MPKINVYLPDELAEAVREAQLPVSSICQVALESAVRDVSASRAVDLTPAEPEVSGRGPRLFSRFSPRARSAVAGAEAEARTAGFRQVGTEHLLLGVLDQPDNLALTVLEALDVEPPDLRAEVVASMPRPPAAAKPGEGRARFSAGAKSVLEASLKEALGFGHNYIGCEHLLLGLLATDDGLASQVMRQMGLELRTTRRAVTGALAGLATARRTQSEADAPPPDDRAPERDPVLDQILERLNAIEGRLAG